jgi:hypothetical protein
VIVSGLLRADLATTNHQDHSRNSTGDTMALMIGTLYDALADAGARPELAQAAAEEVCAQRLMDPDRPSAIGNLELRGAVRNLEIKVNLLAGMNLLLLVLLFMLAARI